MPDRREDPADALVRLRAHAISRTVTASQVAYQILDKRLVLDDDHGYETAEDQEGAS